MPRIPPGGGGGGAGTGTGPGASQQAEAARRLQRDLRLAEERVMVIDKGGEYLDPAPLRFVGAGVQAASRDMTERVTVVRIPGSVLFGPAASRPPSPPFPCLYIAQDTGAHFSWDGATWRPI